MPQPFITHTTLDENDYLTCHLYTASKTPRVRTSRMVSWIVVTVAPLFLAYIFYEKGDDIFAGYFLVCAGLLLVLYPLFLGWRYKKLYLKFVRDAYKNRFGERSEIEFTDDAIISRDKTGEMKINRSEITEIHEIRDYYFLKVSSGVTFIIAKNKTENMEKVNREIEAMVAKGAKHNIELNWKWR